MGRFKKFKKSNKHKKLKPVDPFYTGSRKDELWKTKVVNNSAKHIEHQPLPRKAMELKKICEDLKKGIDFKEQKYFLSQRTRNRGGKKPVVEGPAYKQGKRESDKQFMKRVQCETVAYIAKFKQEEKMGLHPDEPDEIEKKSKKSSKAKPCSSSTSAELNADTQAKSSKAKDLKSTAPADNAAQSSKNGGNHRKQRMQHKRDKLRSRKQFKSTKNNSGFEHLEDKVEFGEVAHRPPDITFRPRKADCSNLQRPGLKQSLLLRQTLSEGAPALSRQQQLLQSREDAVAAYRLMKKQRTAANE